MSGNTYLWLNGAIVTVGTATQVSVGSLDAGQIVALNSSGEIDISMLGAISGNIDGGSADAIYTLPQIIDGGNA